jgi:hypothetical protein
VLDKSSKLGNNELGVAGEIATQSRAANTYHHFIMEVLED